MEVVHHTLGSMLLVEYLWSRNFVDAVILRYLSLVICTLCRARNIEELAIIKYIRK